MASPRANWCQESANLGPINVRRLKVLLKAALHYKKHTPVLSLPRSEQLLSVVDLHEATKGDKSVSAVRQAVHS